MKCIKNGNEVRRVTDEQATEMVAKGSWAYCPKSEWKVVKGSKATEVAEHAQPSEKKKKHRKEGKKAEKAEKRKAAKAVEVAEAV